MPAHAKYPSPPVQLRVVLARQRREGVPFPDAWAAALGTRRRRSLVKFPHATEHRRGWRAAFESQREVWEAAYEGRPCRVSAALVVLADLLVADCSQQRGGGEPGLLARAPFSLAASRASGVRVPSDWPETAELAA